MGANSSRSTEGKNHGDLENRKSSRRISYRLKWKRRAPSIDLNDQDEPCDNTSNVTSGSLASSVASTTATTRENEKSEIRNSTLQRMLPSIPGTAKESDSDLGKLAHHTDSRCDGAPELVRQSSSQRAEDDGTEPQAFTDEKEDPDRNVDDAASTFESADVTYMQINSSDVTCISQTDRLIAPSETNENNGVPEALVNNNEGEDAALYQVITPNLGNDYVRTDFNINAAGTNAQTTKTQAIVGPTSSGPRVHAGLFLYPVQPGTKLTLKMKASILMKTDFRPDWCWINVRVVLGCPEDEIARQKTMEKLQIYKSDGFRMLDSIEFDLFAGESKSTVSVKISKIQWMPDGDITHGDIDNEEFGLHHLWNHGFAEAMFWQWSQITSGVKPKAFAATVHVQQDDRQDMRKKIFYLLESSLLYNEQQHIPVNDYTMIQRPCDKLTKDFPSCVSVGVAVPSRSSCCSSEYKFSVDLHSDNSVPGAKASVLVESLDRQKKSIETAGAVKL